MVRVEDGFNIFPRAVDSRVYRKSGKQDTSVHDPFDPRPFPYDLAVNINRLLHENSMCGGGCVCVGVRVCVCVRVRACVCATTIVHVSTNISEKGARERLCVARRASLCVRGRAVTAVGGAGSSQRVEGL